MTPCWKVWVRVRLPWLCCIGCRVYVAWVAVVMLRYLGKQSQLQGLDWGRSLTISEKSLHLISPTSCCWKCHVECILIMQRLLLETETDWARDTNRIWGSCYIPAEFGSSIYFVASHCVTIGVCTREPTQTLTCNSILPTRGAQQVTEQFSATYSLLPKNLGFIQIIYLPRLNLLYLAFFCPSPAYRPAKSCKHASNGCRLFWWKLRTF